MKADSAEIPCTLLLRTEALGFPIFWLLLQTPQFVKPLQIVQGFKAIWGFVGSYTILGVIMFIIPGTLQIMTTQPYRPSPPNAWIPETQKGFI